MLFGAFSFLCGLYVSEYLLSAEIVYHGVRIELVFFTCLFI